MTRNCYRNLVIEFYARNSSSVQAVTHKAWPDKVCPSQPQLARLLSAEVGWNVDYRSLSRQLRRIQPTDPKVLQRIRQLTHQ